MVPEHVGDEEGRVGDVGQRRARRRDEAEVEERWGGTEAYKASEKRWKSYTEADLLRLKEDLYAIPNENLTGQPQPMEPYYVIMRLPGDEKEEFMLMLPFAPARRQNMVAWLSVKSDGADYGKQLVYRFPKDKLIYGPEQISARINQNPAISSQLTLLSQRGSRVTFGNLLVIPIAKSLIYVQPLYLIAEQSQIPQLKFVIVATGTTITMQPTLTDALAQLFSGLGTQVATNPPATGTP